MGHFEPERFRHQVSFLQRQLLQEGKLPFTDIPSEENVRIYCRVQEPTSGILLIMERCRATTTA